MKEVSSGNLVCDQTARTFQAGNPSLWDPQIMLLTRAGHPQRVTVVIFGLFRLEYGGSIEREPRL
eukprot:8109584-Pyramimonas_sp.AAC.1